MQCPCPISIRDPRGTTNAQRIEVPCNKCPVCLANKRAEWSFRLHEELRTAQNAWFLTLTYSDEQLNYKTYGTMDLEPELSKRHVQLFNKRLRKSITTYEGKVSKKHSQTLEAVKMRFYAVGEYGTKTKRPHYHGIYFNIPEKIINDLEKIWGKGQIHIGKVTPKSIHYTCKYVIQQYEEYPNVQKPFALMSRRPGIGHKYLERADAWHVKNLTPYCIKQGYKVKMPSYYKQKIFTESEKDKMKAHFQMLQDNLWITHYEKMYARQQISYIENQFRVIRKQSKSQ